MMGEIYSRCFRCLIWIDTNRSVCSDGETASDWDNGPGDAVRKFLRSFRPESALDTKISAPAEIDAAMVESTVRDHLLWFLEHPWFSRVWVFQEFLLSKETIFLIGDFHLPGDELENVFKAGVPRSSAWWHSFRHTFRIPTRRASNFNSAPGIEFLLTACTSRMLWGSPQAFGDGKIAETVTRFPHLERHRFQAYEPCTWMDMVSAMAAGQATDPRDHVYAFISLAPFLLRHMGVDYTMSIAETFATSVKAFIKESKSLEFLTYLPFNADVSRSKLNLPSWVPDWTVGSIFSSITCQDNLFCASGRDFGLPLIKSCRHYDATEPIWQSLKWNELRVAGKIIDIVAFKLKDYSIYQALPFTDIDHHNCSGRLPWDLSTLDAFIADLIEQGCSKDAVISREALLRTLFVDGVQWAALDSLLGNSLYRVDTQVMDLPHYTKIKDVIAVILLSPEPDLDNLPHGASLQVLHELSKTQYRRKAVFCARGRFALVPDMVEKGDKIALLHGSRTPVLLRQRQNATYAAIGQCYYDGAMYGELADSNEDHADTFVLS
ncbi:hypothetical protein AC578_3961 [Pseudocercospora eumusae]|uniref:Uncharacterized protein n=1 Tax=Pseudocercospora eumusae TaxID=321146 RepID=A0A139HLH5_9PEZI|nr:hypothetical protein AC578_3961 [Pseudocercospora eumusae]